MPTTGGRALRYPASTAAPNVVQDIQNLANDVDNNMPYPWFTIMNSATSYTFSPVSNGVWENLTGGTGTTVVIPTGRQLDVEFSATAGQAVGTFFLLRLLVGGTPVAGAWWDNGRSPARLSGTMTGTGATVNVAVQAQRTSAGTGMVDAGGVAPVTLRYRVT